MQITTTSILVPLACHPLTILTALAYAASAQPQHRKWNPQNAEQIQAIDID
jgi:hypothetical protein